MTALTARQRAAMREVDKRLGNVEKTIGALGLDVAGIRGLIAGWGDVEKTVGDVREEVAEIRGLIAGVFSDKLPNRRR